MVIISVNQIKKQFSGPIYSPIQCVRNDILIWSSKKVKPYMHTPSMSFLIIDLLDENATASTTTMPIDLLIRSSGDLAKPVFVGVRPRATELPCYVLGLNPKGTGHVLHVPCARESLRVQAACWYSSVRSRA